MNKKVIGKALLLLFLIILFVFIFLTARKMIILSNLKNKQKEMINEDNYYAHLTSYTGTSMKTMDIYHKNDKHYMKEIEFYTPNDVKIFDTYHTGKQCNTYITTESGKYVQKNGQAYEPYVLYNDLEYTKGFWSFVKQAVISNIKSDICNGKECYNITNLLDDYKNVYIEKDTGLVVRIYGFETSTTLKDQTTIKTNGLIDFSYEFNQVKDDVFIEPNPSEYTDTTN